MFRAAQVFLVDIKTNWFIIIRVAQGFRVVQYFLDFSETQCCSKPCSLNPCSSRTHCSRILLVIIVCEDESRTFNSMNMVLDDKCIRHLNLQEIFFASSFINSDLTYQK